MEEKSLAAEIMHDLVRKNKRKRRVIILLTAIILLLTTMLIAPRCISPAHNGREKVKLNSEFTATECDYFRRYCNFTDEERRVFDMRVKGRSNTEISLKLCMSESTVDRRVRAIKRKIIKVL